MNCGIYIIKSKVDNRCYIGQTKCFRERFYKHKSDLKSNRHCNKKLQSFANKYGITALSFEVLEKCDQCSLNEREYHWITTLNVVENGFNLYWEPHDSPWNYEDAKRKIHATREKNSNGKYIYAYNKITGSLIYEGFGICKAARHFNILEQSIEQCLYKNGKSAKGIHFSFILKLPEEVIKSVKRKEYKFKERV